MCSETVRKPQLFITTPDPCGHYLSTVTHMCGNITGVQTSTVELEFKFMETACEYLFNSVLYKYVILIIMYPVL